MDVGSPDGNDLAGLYAAKTWNNDIYFHASDPFAMDIGNLDRALLSNFCGSETAGGKMSYYRAVSFDITGLGSDLDAHWTMSCGNDVIDGGVTLTYPNPPRCHC